jgi:peptidoglycan/xylan/chitin deacetylase (PgdA/CDA1 family)
MRRFYVGVSIMDSSFAAILNYHEIKCEKVFNFQIQNLTRIGRFSNISSILERKEETFGDNQRPDLLLTFDDGYDSQYEVAQNILSQQEIPAIFFIVTNWVGRKGYMTWQQLRELVEYRQFSIGSHTVNHPNLINLSDKDLDHELSYSKSTIEDKLGTSCGLFAIPFGKKTKHYTSAVLEKIGAYYPICFANNRGYYHNSSKNHLEIPRIVPPDTKFSYLFQKLVLNQDLTFADKFLLRLF